MTCALAEQTGIVGRSHLIHIDAESIVIEHYSALVVDRCGVGSIGIGDCTQHLVAIAIVHLNLGDITAGVCDRGYLIVALSALHCRHLSIGIVGEPPFIGLVKPHIFSVYPVATMLHLIGIFDKSLSIALDIERGTFVRIAPANLHRHIVVGRDLNSFACGSDIVENNSHIIFCDLNHLAGGIGGDLHVADLFRNTI